MLLEPVVTFFPDSLPKNALLVPVVLSSPAKYPTAVLLDAVFAFKLSLPIAVLFAPVVTVAKEDLPIATL